MPKMTLEDIKNYELKRFPLTKQVAHFDLTSSKTKEIYRTTKQTGESASGCGLLQPRKDVKRL